VGREVLVSPIDGRLVTARRRDPGLEIVAVLCPTALCGQRTPVAILPEGLRARGHIIGYSEFSQVRRVLSSFQTERARGTAEVLQSSPQV
jgi:hypothetical protein